MRKRNLQSVRFNTGVLRKKYADLNRPYDIRNAIIDRDERVRALVHPTVASPATFPIRKPYFEWNGQMLDRDLLGDVIEDEYVETSDNIRAFESEGPDLYATTFFGTSQEYPRVVRMFEDYDPTVDPDVNIESAPPTITDGIGTPIDMQGGGGGTGVYSSITASAQVAGSPDLYLSYVAIPYNSKGEAGTWHWFSAETTMQDISETGGATSHVPNHVSVIIGCNESVERVDVYKSTLQDIWGYTTVGDTFKYGSVTVTLPDEFKRVRNNQMMFVGTFKPAPFVANPNAVVFIDDKFFIDDTQYGFLVDQTGEAERVLEAVDEFGLTLLPSETISAISSPSRSTLLLKDRNYARQVDNTDDIPGTIAARTMLNDGGTMVYGDVTISTADPYQNTGLREDVGGVDPVQLQFEYEDENGNTFYGPLVTFAQPIMLKVAWNGEKALLVYRDEGAGHNLWERIEPNAEGWYISAFNRATFGEPINVTYHEDALVGVTMDTFAPQSETLTQNYPSTCLLSAPGLPGEISFDTFRSLDNRPVVLLAPLRLSEEEGVTSYRFALFTDKSVQIYDRQERSVTLIDNIASNIGIKERTVSDLGTAYIDAAHVVTNYGVVFVGTDERLYLLDGRQLHRLDKDIPEVFTDVRDVVYDPQNEWLYVIDADVDVWIYSFEFRGWVGRYSLDNDHAIHHLYYQTEAALGVFGTTEISAGVRQLIFDEGGSAVGGTPTVRLTTQPIDSSGKETRVEMLEVAYELTGYDNTDRTTWALLTHELEDNATIVPSYRIPRSRPIYPTLIGRGHQFHIDEFDELRDFEIQVSQRD